MIGTLNGTFYYIAVIYCNIFSLKNREGCTMQWPMAMGGYIPDNLEKKSEINEGGSNM